ncbi:MAG: nucleoside-diphosphate kinase [Candidatus Babeliales bacterium]
MSLQRTFAIIKPDAVEAGHVDDIIEMIEDHGFDIIAGEEIDLDKAQAQQFYAVHKDRPFYGELVSYMTSGPVVLLVLEKENAVEDWRKLMGATDPKKAEAGTVRALYGTDISKNATHGSDSAENAAIEIEQFFPDLDEEFDDEDFE